MGRAAQCLRKDRRGRIALRLRWVRVMANGRQHDQADMAVPAVPGPALVVVEAKLVLGGFEAVLNGTLFRVSVLFPTWRHEHGIG